MTLSWDGGRSTTTPYGWWRILGTRSICTLPSRDCDSSLAMAVRWRHQSKVCTCRRREGSFVIWRCADNGAHSLFLCPDFSSWDAMNEIWDQHYQIECHSLGTHKVYRVAPSPKRTASLRQAARWMPHEVMPSPKASWNPSPFSKATMNKDLIGFPITTKEKTHSDMYSPMEILDDYPFRHGFETHPELHLKPTRRDLLMLRDHSSVRKSIMVTMCP